MQEEAKENFPKASSRDNWLKRLSFTRGSAKSWLPFETTTPLPSPPIAALLLFRSARPPLALSVYSVQKIFLRFIAASTISPESLK